MERTEDSKGQSDDLLERLRILQSLRNGVSEHTESNHHTLLIGLPLLLLSLLKDIHNEILTLLLLLPLDLPLLLQLLVLHRRLQLILVLKRPLLHLLLPLDTLLVSLPGLRRHLLLVL